MILFTNFLGKYTFLSYLILFSIILSFVFRSLLFNISTDLLDWRDYALVNWILVENVEKIINLQFSNFFDLNAFYPHPYSLLFADTFIPQSLLATPVYLLTHQVILSFNIVFFATLILDYISVYVFWKILFKNSLLAFLGALFFFFSPFFHLEFSHFQMLSYWPFFLSCYFLISYLQANRQRNLVLSGFFLAIQFLASVYLAVFLIFTIGLIFLIQFLHEKKFRKLLMAFLIIFLVFVLIDGLVIQKYGQMKNFYQIKREFSEYVTYSAQLSDYLFTTPINSLLHKSLILNKWNAFDMHNLGAKAAFPGFLLFTLSILGLIKILRQKEKFQILISLDKYKVIFLSIAVIGLLFSLGPRLSFNGNYAYIPTPYNLLIKLIPFLEATRVLARWSFLFYLGIIFFGLIFLQERRVKSHFVLLISFVFIFFIFEYLPLNIQTHSEKYIDQSYQAIESLCQTRKMTLLEIPVTHLDVVQGIGEGVNYISKVELASTFHHCNLVNGYSGYDMPEIFTLRDRLYSDLENNDLNSFIRELKSNKVEVLKINQQNLIKKIQLPAANFIEQFKKRQDIKQIVENTFLIIY